MSSSAPWARDGSWSGWSLACPGSAATLDLREVPSLRRHGRAQYLGQAVDLRPRALLGDRHEQAVVELRVIAAERVAGIYPLLTTADEDSFDGRREPNRELPDHWLLVE